MAVAWSGFKVLILGTMVWFSTPTCKIRVSVVVVLIQSQIFIDHKWPSWEQLKLETCYRARDIRSERQDLVMYCSESWAGCRCSKMQYKISAGNKQQLGDQQRTRNQNKFKTMMQQHTTITLCKDRWQNTEHLSAQCDMWQGNGTWRGWWVMCSCTMPMSHYFIDCSLYLHFWTD